MIGYAIIYGLKRNESIFYVGITKCPKTRMWLHKKNHGEDIEMIVLEKTEVKQNNPSGTRNRHIERWWIDFIIKTGHSLINIRGVCR